MTLATEVHHRVKCHDNPALQMDARNLESICNECPLPRSPPTIAVASAMRPTVRAMLLTNDTHPIGHA